MRRPEIVGNRVIDWFVVALKRSPLVVDRPSVPRSRLPRFRQHLPVHESAAGELGDPDRGNRLRNASRPADALCRRRRWVMITSPAPPRVAERTSRIRRAACVLPAVVMTHANRGPGSASHRSRSDEVHGLGHARTLRGPVTDADRVRASPYEGDHHVFGVPSRRQEASVRFEHVSNVSAEGGEVIWCFPPKITLQRGRERPWMVCPYRATDGSTSGGDDRLDTPPRPSRSHRTESLCAKLIHDERVHPRRLRRSRSSAASVRGRGHGPVRWLPNPHQLR